MNTNTAKHWDVFVCHASSDKDVLVRELAQRLQQAGLRVWIDAEQIRAGDSLRSSIDSGLAGSRFAVVIVSEASLQGAWPQRELGALYALHDAGEIVILPVYTVARRLVAQHQPLLAGVAFLEFRGDVAALADQLVARVLTDTLTPAVAAPTARLHFERLLQSPNAADEVWRFLQARPWALPTALGVQHEPDVRTCSIAPPPHRTLAVTHNMPSRRIPDLAHLVTIAAPDASALDADGAPTAELIAAIRTAEQQSPAMRGSTDLRSNTVVLGRRRDVTDHVRRHFERVQRERGVEVRTHDWIADALPEVIPAADDMVAPRAAWQAPLAQTKGEAARRRRLAQELEQARVDQQPAGTTAHRFDEVDGLCRCCGVSLDAAIHFRWLSCRRQGHGDASP